VAAGAGLLGTVPAAAAITGAWAVVLRAGWTPHDRVAGTTVVRYRLAATGTSGREASTRDGAPVTSAPA
jgi:hypothetical protein